MLQSRIYAGRIVTPPAITIDALPARVAGLSMLAVAAAWPWLPSGVIPPCPLRSLTGVPCPLCGMTTSVVETVQGDVTTALHVNPFGPLLVGFVVLLFIVRRRREWRFAVSALIPLALVSWIFQLARFGWI